ncbi:MAG: chloride channel protein [Bacteroidia bacterium]|jgi:CIC family chloride channel protein|nr:chloride channel protein [Bacteroidia bacterium]
MKELVKRLRVNAKLWIYRITKQRHQYISDQNFLIIAAIWVGILAGTAAVVLKSTVHAVQHWLADGWNVRYENYLYLIYPLVGIVLSVAYVRLFHHRKSFDKGLSSIIYAIHKKFSTIELHKTYSHIVTSALTIGFGGSAGLEAPIAVTGSALGSNTAKNLLMSRSDRTLLLASGAAAGISAIFNSPIAGVLFAFEVLLTQVSIPAFIPLLIASATGAVVSKLFYSGQLFYLTIDSWRVQALPFYALLGVCCGAVSVYMIRTTLKVEGLFSRTQNPYFKGIIGGIGLGVLIFIFPPLYGEGYEISAQLMQGSFTAWFDNSLFYNLQHHTWFVLLFGVLLVLVKVIASSITVGSGGNGGIFGPSLFTGSVLGFVFAHAINLTGIITLNEQNFVAVAMGGLISGVLHAPLTAIFLIAEITGGYALFVPLMVVSAIAYFFTRYFEPNSIYTKTLIERGQMSSDNDTNVLNQLNLEMVIESDFTSLLPDQKLRTLVDTISQSKRNVFPVVNRNGLLVGIITLDDIRDVMFTHTLYDRLTISQLMRAPKIVAHNNMSLDLIMPLFEQYQVWYIPVITQQGNYIGFISKSSVLHLYRARVLDQMV